MDLWEDMHNKEAALADGKECQNSLILNYNG